MRPAFHIIFFQRKKGGIAARRFQKRAVRPETAPSRRVFYEKILVRIVRKIGAMAFCTAFRKAFDPKMVVRRPGQFALPGIAFEQALREDDARWDAKFPHFRRRDGAVLFEVIEAEPVF